MKHRGAVNRWFAYFSILACIVSLSVSLLPPRIALAATTTDQGASNAAALTAFNACMIATGGLGGPLCIGLTPAAGAVGAVANQVNQGRAVNVGTAVGAGVASVAEGVTAGIGAGLDWAAGGLLQLISVVIVIITEVIIWIFTWILGIVGWLFSLVVNEFVLGMGKYVTSPEATAVRNAWILIRDLANVAIIGGMIATAIGTIIGSQQYNAQQNLARLILAALLVNFSFFVAGALVDAANFTARAAYQEVIYRETCGDAGGECGIGERFADATSLSTWRQGIFVAGDPGPVDANPLATRATGKLTTPATAAAYNIMMLIFVGITIFIFLSVIAMLVARFIALIFLIITSPIGIAGLAVPFLNEYAKKWWKELYGQALFAPVYFILAGISLNMLEQFRGAIFNAVLDPVLAPLAGASAGVNPGLALGLLAASGGPLSAQMPAIVGVVAVFTIAIGFMWAALSAAKSLSKTEWFGSIYGAAEKMFGWMPKGYVSMMKAGGAMALRNTVGFAGEKFGLKYADWASKQEWIREGKIGGKEIPGLRMVAGALDRAVQGQVFDKARDAKFFGRPTYDEERKKRDARQNELDDLHKDRANDKKAKGTGAEEKLAARKKELEELEKAALAGGAPLSKEDEAELAAIRRYEAIQGEEGALVARKEHLEAEKKKRALSDSEKSELRNTKKRLAEIKRLKDKFGIGGAIDKIDRAEAMHREVYNDGTAREYVNEIDHHKALEAKEAAQRARGEEDLKGEDELRLAKLTAEKAAWLAQGKNIADWKQKAEHDALLARMTSGERQDLKDYRERLKGLSPEERAELALRKGRIGTAAEQPDDKKRIAELEAKEKKLRLKDRVLESDASFRTRQITREDGHGRRFFLEKDEEGNDVWVAETDDQYYERLDLDQSIGDIGHRKARTEGEEIGINFSNGFAEREYRKDHDSIIKYAKLLPKNKVLEIARNHNIRESVREAMLSSIGQPWTQMIIDVEDRVRRGELTRGSKEYQDAILVPYNYQSNNLKDAEIVAELVKSDAIAGYSNLDKNGNVITVDGVPLAPGDERGTKIRFRDMWGTTYRESFWQGSLTSTFAHIKDNKILGDTAMRDARTAKGRPFDSEDDQLTGAVTLEGYADNEEYVRMQGHTVQLDSATRRNQWAEKTITDTGKVIRRYEADIALNGTSNIPEKEYRVARENHRWATMVQGGAAASPMRADIEAARRVSDITPERLEHIKSELGKVFDIDPGTIDVADKDWSERVAAFSQGMMLQESRAAFEDRLARGDFGDTRAPNTDAMNDTEFHWYRKRKSEQALQGRYEGKTPEEIQKLFNRRSMWRPGMAIGIRADQLLSVQSVHDPQERMALLKNILKFGDMALIRDLYTNEMIRKDITWPSEKEMRELNFIRVSGGGESLPISGILRGA